MFILILTIRRNFISGLSLYQPSFVFSNDAMQNLNGSTVPSLKSLISALIGGIPQKDGNVTQ